MKSILINRENYNHSSKAENRRLSAKKLKFVHWDDLTIYEFPNGLGDNPAVRSGCPISLDGWHYKSKTTINLDYHEYVKCQTYEPPRTRKQLKIGHEQRNIYLTDMLGYSINEVNTVAKECEKIRASRKKNARQAIDTALSIISDDDIHEMDNPMTLSSWAHGFDFLKKIPVVYTK